MLRESFGITIPGPSSIKIRVFHPPPVSATRKKPEPPYTTATLKAIPRRCSTRIINHPTTPPIAQMSKVIRLMGIGGERNRFVRISSTTPTSVFDSKAHQRNSAPSKKGQEHHYHQ